MHMTYYKLHNLIIIIDLLYTLCAVPEKYITQCVNNSTIN